MILYFMHEIESSGLEASLFSRLKQNTYAHLLLIFFLALIVYSNTMSVPLQFDDTLSVSVSPEGRSFGASIKRIRYVGEVFFSLNYWLHGTNVIGYHILNILIHSLNSFLIYTLVMLLFRTPRIETSSHVDKARYFSLSAALLFACHPIQTQSVTYISQRFTSLATFFYLLAVVSYLQFRLKVSPLSRIAWYLLTIVSAILAMKTKEIAFTLPIMIGLCEFIFFGGKFSKRIRNLTPLLITLLIIPITLLSLGVSPGELMREAGEATRLLTDIPRSEYFFTQFRVIVTYVRLLLLPVNQNLDYDYPLFRSFFDYQVLFSFLFLLSIFTVGVLCLFRLAKKEPATRLVSFGIFWFFLALSVESSIIPIKDVIFEHRLYLPSIGIVISVPIGIYLLADKTLRRYLTYAVSIAILLLSGATFTRNFVWQSKLSLWEDVVEKSPRKTRAHNNLGDAYQSLGLIDDAIGQFQMVIQLDPNNFLAHKNLSQIYAEQGLMKKSVEHFNAVLRINPEFEDAYLEMGNAYKRKGMLDKAIEFYRMTVELKPSYAGAQYNLGLAYYENNQYEEAEKHMLKASRQDPTNSESFHVLGNIYRAQGQTEKAVEYYERTLRLDPDNVDVNYNLGIIFGLQGKLDPAIKHFEAALQQNPSLPGARQNLGNAYAMSGQPFKAIDQFLLALKQDPDNAEIHYNLSEVYRSTGINRKADEHRMKAFRLDPSLVNPKH